MGVDFFCGEIHGLLHAGDVQGEGFRFGHVLRDKILSIADLIENFKGVMIVVFPVRRKPCGIAGRRRNQFHFALMFGL